MYLLEKELLVLVRRFHEAEVNYAICGALALSIHGHPRATTDIDFVIALDSMLYQLAE